MKRLLALAVVIALGAAGGQAQAAYCKDPTTHKRISCKAAAATPAPAAATASKPAPAMAAAPAKKPSMFAGMMKPKATVPAATTQSPAPATRTVASTASMASGGRKAPHCVKGKLCGMSCIKATDVCHKPT